MKLLRQLYALLQISFTGISQRWGAALVTVIGISCVVAVLVALLSMGNGFRKSNTQNIRADRVVIRASGTSSDFASDIERSAARTIMDSPGIKKSADGVPLATAVTLAMGSARKKSDNSRASFPIIGVDKNYFKVWPEVHITAGRMFKPAVYELIVGKSRHELFKDLEIGDRVHMHGVDWTIVGHFDSGGGLVGRALMGDVDTIISVYKRNTTQSIAAILEAPSKFGDLNEALKSNPTYDVQLLHESETIEQTIKRLKGIMDFVAYFVGGVMALGATLGAVNVMYSNVDSRKREMATLQAIGFKPSPVVLSVLIESLGLAIPAAMLGIFVAWAFFNGNAVTPYGVSFTLSVTPQLAVIGIVWAVLMGIIGGLMPAIRAARVPLATALRAT